MNKVIISLTVVAAFFVLLIIGYVTLFETYEVHATAEDEFILPVDFVVLRKKLVRENVLEQLIEAQNGKLVYHKWEKIGFNVDRYVNPLTTWEVKAKGHFQVRSSDANMGDFLLTLSQDAIVKPNSFTSRIENSAPVKSLQYYHTDLELCSKGGQTKAVVKVNLIYRRKIPKFGNYRQVMDTKVNEASTACVARTKQAFMGLLK